MAVADIKVYRSRETLHTLTPHGSVTKKSWLAHRQGSVTPGFQFLLLPISLNPVFTTWPLHEYKEVTLVGSGVQRACLLAWEKS